MGQLLVKPKTVLEVVKANSPVVYSIGATVGVAVTGVLSAQAGIKANKLLEEEDANEKFMDKAKKIAVCVAPAVLSGAATIACIVGINKAYAREIATMASAYAMANGDKLTKGVKDASAKEEFKACPQSTESAVNSTEVMEVRDSVIGFKFQSSVADLFRAAMKVNSLIGVDTSAFLSEFYEELGIDEFPEIANQYRWRAETSSDMGLEVDTEFDDNYKPRIVIRYRDSDDPVTGTK